ncbi:MAG: NUDIX domain-containing protein [Minwuia sp.]|nr:NUDIX domain-containing protein [Minwuia sp.]
MSKGNVLASGADLSGKYADVVPRPASSILLIRDTEAGLEVFMVKRHHKIDFASGAMVFPGGKVDPEDSDAEARAATIGAEHFDDTQLGFRVSAIREAFEETGVLIATQKDGSELTAARTNELKDRYAARLEKNQVTMGQMATAEGLAIRVDRLEAFAHWITPPVMPKRFDTPFFIAEAPEAQIDGALHDGKEAVESVWTTPAAVMEQVDRGEVTMVFATRLNLQLLGEASNVAEAMAAAARRTPVIVTPHVYVKDGRRMIDIPADAGFGKATWDVGEG